MTFYLEGSVLSYVELNKVQEGPEVLANTIYYIMDSSFSKYFVIQKEISEQFVIQFFSFTHVTIFWMVKSKSLTFCIRLDVFIDITFTFSKTLELRPPACQQN